MKTSKGRGASEYRNERGQRATRGGKSQQSWLQSRRGYPEIMTNMQPHVSFEANAADAGRKGKLRLEGTVLSFTQPLHSQNCKP